MRLAAFALALATAFGLPVAAPAQEGAKERGTITVRLIRAEGKVPLADTRAAVTVGRMEGGPDKMVYDPGAGHTDADGVMKVRYPVGVLQVQVHVRGFAYAVSKAFKLEANAEKKIDFELVPGSSVRGQVIAKAFHSPLADARVSVMTATHSANVQQTEVDGGFEFVDLPPGNHRIRIDHPDHPMREVDFAIEAGRALDLEQLPLEPPSFGRIALEVYLPGQPAPLREYDVVVTWEVDGKPEGFPGAVRGIDTFLVKVPPGNCILKIEKAGYRPAIVAILVPRGLTVPAKVRLRPEEKK